MRPRRALLPPLLAAASTAAEADVIWPAMPTERLLTWWVIGVSLVIEFFFVRSAFRLSVAKAAWATLVANALSAAAGLFVVPSLASLFVTGLHASGIGVRLDWAEFGPADWAVLFLAAVVFNLAVELAAFRYGFRLQVDKRAVGLILIANVITVGLALLCLAGIPSLRI
jgi:hypothetical protein